MKRKNVPRQRDAARTRDALIEAARWLFTRHAYDQLGTRDIAERAGVDAALVHRYFGTKEKLFAKAIEKAYTIVQYLGDTPLADMPARFAELMIDSKKDRERFDATMVLLRSASSSEVQKLLARGLEDDFITPLADLLGGPQWRTRTAMTLAILAGFETLRSVLRNDALNQPEARELLERAVRACLVGDGPPPTTAEPTTSSLRPSRVVAK